MPLVSTVKSEIRDILDKTRETRTDLSFLHIKIYGVEIKLKTYQKI